DRGGRGAALARERCGRRLRRGGAARALLGCGRAQPRTRTARDRLRLLGAAAAALARSARAQRGARRGGAARPAARCRARADLGGRAVRGCGRDRARIRVAGRTVAGVRSNALGAPRELDMIHALIVSNALLWLLVVALAGVVAALARQVGVLH